MERGDDRDQEPAEREPDQRDQVEERDEHGERHRQVDPEELEHEPGEHAGGDAEQSG